MHGQDEFWSIMLLRCINLSMTQISFVFLKYLFLWVTFPFISYAFVYLLMIGMRGLRILCWYHLKFGSDQYLWIHYQSTIGTNPTSKNKIKWIFIECFCVKYAIWVTGFTTLTICTVQLAYLNEFWDWNFTLRCFWLE